MRLPLVLCILVTPLLAASAAQAETVWILADDFSVSNGNPNGAGLTAGSMVPISSLTAPSSSTRPTISSVGTELWTMAIFLKYLEECRPGVESARRAGRGRPSS